MPHLDIVGTDVATELIICASKDKHIEQVRAKLGAAGLEAIEGGDTTIAIRAASKATPSSPRQGGPQGQRDRQQQRGRGSQRSNDRTQVPARDEWTPPHTPYPAA